MTTADAPAASDAVGSVAAGDSAAGADDECDVRSKWTAGRKLPWLALLVLPAAVLDAGSGFGWAVVVVYDVVLLVGATMQARRLARRVPRIERRVDSRLIVGADNRIELHLHNASPHTLRLTIRDDLPDGWSAASKDLTVEMPPWTRRTVHYEVRPLRRGRYQFGDLHLRMEGRAGLGAAVVSVPAAEPARVYPNVLGPRRYELAARLGDLHYVGFRNVRVAGGAGQFEQLREYVRGDPYRDLDWKSTAKRRRPVTRVYQQERSQPVVLCIDAGRMMATRLGDISKLDHAINAALLLGYVALRHGDRVGLVVFGDTVKSFVPPATGPAHYRRLLDALYAVEAEETAVDFRRFVEFVQLRVKRRSLLVLFSDLLDEAHARPLADHAATLRRKHLPVCVTMDDPVAKRMADQSVDTAKQVYRRAAAADVLAEREAIKAHLAKSAVGLVEAPAGELAVATVNRYLELKARHAL